MTNIVVIKKMLEDLKKHPEGRQYKPDQLTDRLRKFIAEHMPEVEIVRGGRHYIIRLKGVKR